MGESASLRGPAGGCQSSRPGHFPRQPRPRPPLRRQSRAPGTATPGPNHSPPLLPSDRGRGAQTKRVQGWIRSAGVWKKSRPGSARAPAQLFIYPISSSISEMSAKMRKTTSSVSAASIQLRNCSCMVGSRPPGPARAGEKSWSWGAQRQAPEPRRAAGQTRCAPGESGPAAAAAADKGCSGAASPLARSQLASAPPLHSPPLPSPAPRGAQRAV